MLFQGIHLADLRQPTRTCDALIYLYRAFRIAGLLTPHKYRVFYYIWIFVNFFLTMIYLPMNFVWNYVYINANLTAMEFITSLQVALNAVGLAIKLNILRSKISQLKKANQVLDTLDANCTTHEEYFTIRECAAFGNRVYLIYIIIYISYSSVNVIGSLYNGRPPYNIYFPCINWRHNRKQLYLQAFAEYLLVGFASFQASIADSYSIIYVECLRRHVKILSRRISSIDYAEHGNARKKALIDCIKTHKLLLSCYDAIAAVISGTLFTQFLICGTAIGIAIILFMLFTGFSSRLSAMVYMVAVLLQTFPLCFACNCLINDSMNLSIALFHTNWFLEQQSYKKIVLYFMQKLQKPMIFYAYNFFSITLETNIQVAKFAFTVYTLADQSNLADRLANK